MCKPTRFVETVVAALLVAVWVVQQMSHSEEGVTEDTGGNSSVFSCDQQHALQQRHKLPPVGLLCLHVTVIRTENRVYLTFAGSKAHREKTLHEDHTGQNFTPHFTRNPGTMSAAIIMLDL